MAVIKRVRGDNYTLDLEISDADGDAVDLTGATVFFTVKKNFQDTDANALISKSVTSHTSPTEGLTSIPLTSSDTDFEGSYYYDIKIKVGSTLTSVEADKFILLPHVTIRTS